jgi:hypothetical protein
MKISLQKVIERLEKTNDYQLGYDGIESNHIYLDDQFRWSHKNKKGYDEIAKKIDDAEIKGNGYIVYASYDISGYNYWVKQMEESNYMSISILFDNDYFNDDNMNQLINDIDEVFSRCQEIENDTWDYVVKIGKNLR